MRPAARSLFVFGIYVLVTGVAFIVAPDAIKSLLGLPPATAGWLRIIGLLALVIGAYDVVASRAECRPYIAASVYVRFGFATGVALLVVTHEMPLTLLALGAIDVAGALWTMAALRSKGAAVVRPS